MGGGGALSCEVKEALVKYVAQIETNFNQLIQTLK